VSPEGSLYASALLIDPCPPVKASQLGFVAGVALAGAAEDVGAFDARLKWPNDLVIRGAKCAGLLVEGASLPGGGFGCVVGVGVNLSSAPPDVGYPTAILTGREGASVEPNVLFERLAARFEEALATWREGEGFAAIRSAWLARAAGLGERVKIETPAGRREGIFEGLDLDGRLLFRGASGIEAIEAADLWISPASDRAPAAAASALLAGRPGLND
jgi:BirA family biotin operon repressor/biotin-[acetyl-CoA-carboxylase] ligase